jgi:hypothetical protein
MAMFVCASAMADEGHVSQSQLADFGLAGMTTVSDVEATEIRGQGFAFAASISGSGVPGPGEDHRTGQAVDGVPGRADGESDSRRDGCGETMSIEAATGRSTGGRS